MDRRSFAKLLAASATAPALFCLDAQTPQPSAAPQHRFSVMLWTLGRTLPFQAMLKLVSAAGYQGVELTGEVANWTADDAANARRQAASLNLVVDAMDGGRFKLADPGAAPSMMEALTRRLQLANALNCPQLILTPGATLEGASKETMHAAIGENLKRAGDLAAKSNVEILLEPIDLIESKGSCAVYSVADAFEIVRAVGHPNVKVLYDFFHEQRSSGNLLEKLDHNIDLIGLVHIADVPGRHEPGTGEINYSPIYRRLGELHYDRFIAMEFYSTGDALATLRAARLAGIEALNRAGAGDTRQHS